jgi:hypothetical protein
MQYTFMEAEEILDELPDIEDDPTPNSLRTRNLTMILVDGIYDRLQTKGYVQRAPRAGRPDHSPLPSPTAGRADSPGSQEDILQDESPLPAPKQVRCLICIAFHISPLKQRKKKKKKTKQVSHFTAFTPIAELNCIFVAKRDGQFDIPLIVLI